MEIKINEAPKTIKDIMSKNVELVLPNALLTEVAQKMQNRDCGCVLVAKEDRIVGIVTDRDLALRCIAKSHDPAETTAEQVMSPEILYCRDTDEADAVTKNMGENKVRRLAVLDSNKRLVGIVTLGDLASHTNYKLCGEVLGEKLPYLATWQTSKAKDSRGSPFVQHLSCDFILVFIVFRGAGAESLKKEIPFSTACVTQQTSTQIESLTINKPV